MKLYTVKFAINDYTAERRTAYVAAPTAQKATELVGKKNGKFVGYSGRVTEVAETFQTVYLAK